MREVDGGEMLIRMYGEWPSFIDAEVLSINFDRGGVGEFRWPSIEARIHVFAYTGRLDERGRNVRERHSIVTLRFDRVDLVRLENFNHQNALEGLRITDISDRQMEDVRFEVAFEAAWGADCRFVCRAVSVLAVAPFVSDQS